MQEWRLHPVEKCQGPPSVPGREVSYLAASTVEKATARPCFPPMEIRTCEAIPVAFIGLTFEGHAETRPPEKAAGLEFRDEGRARFQCAGCPNTEGAGVRRAPPGWLIQRRRDGPANTTRPGK